MSSLPPPRPTVPTVEEITSSVLLPDPDDTPHPAGKAPIEELSGSVLMEDPTEITGPPQPIPQGVSPDATLPLPDAKHLPWARLQPAPPMAMPSVTPTVRPTVTGTENLAAAPTAANAGTPAPAGNAAPGPSAVIDTPTSTAATIANPVVAAPSRSSAPPPGSSSRPPAEAAHRALLGIPALPRSTPPPRIDGSRRSSSPPAETGDVEVSELPLGAFGAARIAAQRVLKQVTAVLTREPRPKWLLPAIAGGCALVGVVTVAAMRSGKSTATPSTTASTGTTANATSAPAATAVAPPSATTTTTATPTAAAAPSATASARPPVTTPCTVDGTAHVIAPSATVVAGVEVRSLGSDLALGFAPGEHDAMAVRMGGGSLSALSTAHARSTSPIRHVTPIERNGSLVPAVDVEREGDEMQGRRIVPVDPPLQVGAASDNLVWARAGGKIAGKLWWLGGGEGNIEAVRSSQEGSAKGMTTVLAFRRAGSIWLGAASGTSALLPKGGLSHVEGLGGGVGAPAVALSDGVVMVAWADHARQEDPWVLRLLRFKVGDAPDAPRTFSPPAGGNGEQAMSPGLAAVPGGRFLLVWTEGIPSRHDVRALTLGSDGTPIGGPLEVSSDSVNAGQGQAAVTAEGKGVVAFLEGTEGAYHVRASSIKCSL